jgi:hypothetical protein
VLRQLPTIQDLAGIGLVIAGVAVHQAPREATPVPRPREADGQPAPPENQLGRVAHRR